MLPSSLQVTPVQVLEPDPQALGLAVRQLFAPQVQSQPSKLAEEEVEGLNVGDNAVGVDAEGDKVGDKEGLDGQLDNPHFKTQRALLSSISDADPDLDLDSS